VRVLYVNFEEEIEKFVQSDPRKKYFSVKARPPLINIRVHVHSLHKLVKAIISYMFLF